MNEHLSSATHPHRRPQPARLLAGASVLAMVLAAVPASAASAASGGTASGRPAARHGKGVTPGAVIGGPLLAGHGVIVRYPSRGHLPHLPAVPASAYVVADAGSGQVLAAKDPHGRYAPASTLKVLTAAALMPALDPGLQVRASTWAANTEASKVGLLAGHTYRVSDLFKALLLISANDAAVALAQATGSYARGMAIINAEARRLRAGDTVAVRPNGLDARGQHVSAYDEALFARAALAIPQFMRIEKMRTARFPLTRRHRITLYNQNTMLQTFPGDLGGKIGWTTPAEATFIGWARRGGHTLVVTILHATPQTEMQTAASLLSWGFAVDGRIQPVGTLVSPLPVASGKFRARVPARRLPRPVAAQAAPGWPVGAIAAGAGTFAAALLVGTGIMLALRRWRAADGRRGRLPGA